MVKTQTKVTIAILGTALISLALWDRSNKAGLAPESGQDSAGAAVKEDQPYYDPDRVIHRSKREVVGKQLDAIYRQFSNLQGCCNMPELIPSDALDACTMEGQRVGAGLGNKKKGKNQAAGGGGGGGGGGGWLSRVQNQLFGSQKQAAKKTNKQSANKKSANVKDAKGTTTTKAAKATAKRGKRQASSASAQKITLKTVCYFDCIYSYMNFLNDTALDLPLIEETFVGRLQDDSWKQVVQDAMYTCEEPSACASPENVKVGAKHCSIKPTIMQNCMKKQMLLNCPASAKQAKNFQCNAGMTSLKGLNTLNFG